MKSIYEQVGGTYTRQGDYEFPDLKVPPEKEIEIGVWGCLLYTSGDGEPVCAERLVFARETHRAVAVGVGLDDAAHHRLLVDPPADLLEVVRHGVQVDLGPRSFLHNIHNKSPYWQGLRGQDRPRKPEFAMIAYLK